MADCLNNEEQINSNLSESNIDALTSNLDGNSSVTSEMATGSSVSSTMYSSDATTSNLGSEEPLNSDLDLPTTYTYKGSETDNIVVTVDNKGFIISASVKQIKFNSVSDFPEVGSEHLIYIDATNKALYGWDANSGYYKLVADVKVPTKLSEFENDGDGKSPFATVDYVNQNAGGESYDDTEIRGLIDNIEENKADKTELENYYTKTETNGLASTLQANVDKKLDRVDGSTSTALYGVGSSGQQVMFSVAQGTGTNTIVRRTGQQIKVPLAPVENNDATSKSYVDSQVSTIPKFSVEVVTSLPTENISTTTVYLVASGSETQNLYIEYIYVNDTWEKLGEQRIDLSNYPTKEELTEAVTTALVDYYTSEQVDGFISTLNKDITDLKDGKADKSEIPELYSETGQNTNGAMTQKAVTDELNRLGIMYKGVCETDFINDTPMDGSLVIDNFPYQSISECPIGTKFEISFTHPSSEATWGLTLTINGITGIKVGITSRDSVDYYFDTYELSWIANDTIDFEWNGTYLIAKSVSGRLINPDVVTSEFSDTVRITSIKGSVFYPILSYGKPQNTSNLDDNRTTPYETEILHKGSTGETIFNSYNDLPLKINHKSRAFGIGTGTLEDGTTTTGLLLYDDISTKLSDEHKTLLLPRKNGVIATIDDIPSGGSKTIWEVWE